MLSFIIQVELQRNLKQHAYEINLVPSKQQSDGERVYTWGQEASDAGAARIILKFIILDFLYIVGDWILYVIGLVYNFRLLWIQIRIRLDRD